MVGIDGTYHDDDGFSFDSFGTSSIAESVGGLGKVGPCWGDTGDL